MKYYQKHTYQKYNELKYGFAHNILCDPNYLTREGEGGVCGIEAFNTLILDFSIISTGIGVFRSSSFWFLIFDRKIRSNLRPSITIIKIAAFVTL